MEKAKKFQFEQKEDKDNLIGCKIIQTIRELNTDEEITGYVIERPNKELIIISSKEFYISEGVNRY